MTLKIPEEKLLKLKEKYQDADSQKIISSWERSIRQNIAQSGLKDHQVVKQIIKDAEMKIEGINSLLQYDEALTDVERKALFKERSVHQFYLARFDDKHAKKQVEELDRLISEKLNDK